MTIAEQLKIKDFPFIIEDKQGNKIYYEDNYGYWIKREFDKQGDKIYHENSNGIVEDNREEIIEVNGIKYKRI